jgi:vancomycin permeability regulator SanA
VLAHLSYLLADGFAPPTLPADLAIVLGSKVHPDGRPSSGLQRRLERAVQIYRSGAVKAILVSGGRGAEGFEEADVMGDVLIKSGIPSDKILVDRTGRNTRLTAIHAREIMHAHGWRSAVVISQYYHVPRAKLALRQQGIEQISGAAAQYRFAWTDPVSILREFAGWYTYVFRRS